MSNNNSFNDITITDSTNSVIGENNIIIDKIIINYKGEDNVVLKYQINGKGKFEHKQTKIPQNLLPGNDINNIDIARFTEYIVGEIRRNLSNSNDAKIKISETAVEKGLNSIRNAKTLNLVKWISGVPLLIIGIILVCFAYTDKNYAFGFGLPLTTATIILMGIECVIGVIYSAAVVITINKIVEIPKILIIILNILYIAVSICYYVSVICGIFIDPSDIGIFFIVSMSIYGFLSFSYMWISSFEDVEEFTGLICDGSFETLKTIVAFIVAFIMSAVICLSSFGVSFITILIWSDTNSSGVYYQGICYIPDEQDEDSLIAEGMDPLCDEIIIPEEVYGKEVIGINLNKFDNIENVKSFSIGKNVETIYGIYSGLNNLRSIIVDDENQYFNSQGNCLIEKQSKTLVLGCKNSIIPVDGSVTTIRNNAFGGCVGLTNISIPDSITNIGSYAFSGCSALREIAIPQGVNIIRSGTFSGCSSLLSINIHSNIKEIEQPKVYTVGGPVGGYPFAGCSNLETIIVDKNNPVFHSANNCLIKTDEKRLVLGCKNSVVPDDGSVTSIGAGAFSGCRDLISIEIPLDVISFGYGAFRNCSSLTSIEIPSGVTSIGNGTFSGCNSLTSIEIPSGVVSIGWLAFQDCINLTSIVIPLSVTEIDSTAFGGCDKLTIYCMQTSKLDGWDDGWNSVSEVVWGFGG